MQGISLSFDWQTLPDLADDPGSSPLRKFGRRLFNRRMALRMSQSELARRVGAEQGTIWSMEIGKTGCRIERLLDLAAALETTASELLEGIQ